MGAPYRRGQKAPHPSREAAKGECTAERENPDALRNEWREVAEKQLTHNMLSTI